MPAAEQFPSHVSIARPVRRSPVKSLHVHCKSLALQPYGVEVFTAESWSGIIVCLPRMQDWGQAGFAFQI